MRLHELTDAGLQILELLETGNADYSKALSDINTEFNDKVLDCGMVYRNIQVEAEVYKTESKRLADKATSLEKRAEGLRVYVEQQMEQLGIDSIKGATFTVKFRKLPPLVVIVNQDILPKEYIRITPEVKEPDKKKLLEDMTSGIQVQGASLKTDRRKLEIK
jgi:hypothetical protein